MLILAVDDETLMLNMLVETLKNVFSDERYVVMGFDDGKEALEYVSSSEESLPYAFLDIRLRGMLGIELAKEIKEIRSETRIIFCSAYTEYALDAFSVHAVGYLLKPITKAKIQETLDQIDMMLNRDPEPERQKLVVQTFGHFEAFFNDKPLPWERAKAKELLAFLVDQRGASATNAEIALTLWEDDSKVRSVQTIISSLRKTLRRVGMGDVLVRARKCFALCGDLSEGRSLRSNRNRQKRRPPQTRFIVRVAGVLFNQVITMSLRALCRTRPSSRLESGWWCARRTSYRTWSRCDGLREAYSQSRHGLCRGPRRP